MVPVEIGSLPSLSLTRSGSLGCGWEEIVFTLLRIGGRSSKS